MKALQHNRAAVFIAHMLCLGTLVVSGCATNQFLTQGKEYAARGEWDKSVQAFQQAHHEDPADQEVRIHLIRAKRNASLFHMNIGESLLKNHRYDEAMTEFQLAVALDPSNKNTESLMERTRAMKESDYQLKRGENLLKAGNYAQAREALQTALKLYPENKKAQEVLARFRHKEIKPSRFHLKTDPKTPISLKFKNTPILNVFEVLTRLTGVNFLFDKDVQETKVTIFVVDVSFDEFLEIFLRTNKLAADTVNDRTLIIYPDTPQKAKEYQNLQIRTFYLAHIDVKKAVALLSKVLKTKDITPNEALNAVVIRGPKEQVEIAAKMIEANDRPVSEVMLSVEILEVSRTKELNVGVEFSSNSFKLGLGESILGYFNPDPDAEGYPSIGGMSLKALDTVSSQNMLLALPTATVNLLKQDGDTRILANPQLRVKNGEKAKIHIGERVPLRSNRRVDTTGAVTTDFQYQDIGVKVDVEPSINVHGDVAMKLTLEISSLGANVGTTDDPQYAIRTRTAQSVLNIRAGETVVIGGLIQDNERKTVRKLPGIGEIPILGDLLSNYNTVGDETDILMTITPVIIRNQEMPDRRITHIWSGKEDDFSQREPFESIAEREGQFMEKPAPLKEEKPAAPGPPPIPGVPVPQQAPPLPPPPRPEEILPAPPPLPPKTGSMPGQGSPASPATPPVGPLPAVSEKAGPGPTPAAGKTGAVAT
ncbi:MAG: tetratricopeptide repeat protein, partial [Deltaproteobacteria bacterium]|nr:tetratricopeptide repeat protein [Deltaproteobacteria bacterium]